MKQSEGEVVSLKQMWNDDSTQARDVRSVYGTTLVLIAIGIFLWATGLWWPLVNFLFSNA